MSVVEDASSKYAEMTVGKIVAQDYRKAMVFKSHGIDFCCGGAISVKKVAEENEVDLTKLLDELSAIDFSETLAVDYENWSLDKLVDHIVDVHHSYVRNTITQLLPMLTKVEMVHGNWRPELIQVNAVFNELAAELAAHMQKEEMILFPAIKEIVAGYEQGSNTCFGSVRNPINMMEHEHDIAGDLMKEINALTEGYTLPKGACATYTVVYKVLKEFEEDLHTHIHLENNILFPKAINLEEN